MLPILLLRRTGACSRSSLQFLKLRGHGIRFLGSSHSFLDVLKPLQNPRFNNSVLNLCNPSLVRHFSAFEQFSDDEYDDDFQQQNACSSVANIDEWRWKLSLFLRNKEEKEIVSRDKSDKRDYEQISALAKRMDLFCELYGNLVVVSKVPLPNYRPDLDEKRPQREVVIPLGLQRRVESLLQEYIDRKQFSSTCFSSDKAPEEKENVNAPLEQTEDHIVDPSVLEKVLQRQSWRILNLQRSWQESIEGQKMISFRRSLPAFKEKDNILQAIAKHQVLVISGETGCGKTTQLPQYVLESEIESGRGAFCNIICTQPRRISAMAVAERVATERGENLGDSVGYKVRFEGMRGKSTRLLFCTSGVLLRRLLIDQNIKGVTHVFIDEIHERGMNEDFLLIILKDLLPKRPDLRLILMSATLNADLFSSYFGGAPVIHIPGFTHPVRAHFLEDVLEMTGYKLSTFNQTDDFGQNRFWKPPRFGARNRRTKLAALAEDALLNADFDSYSAKARESLSNWTPDSIGFSLIEAILCHICRKEKPGAVLVFMTGWDDISGLKDQIKAHPLLGDPNRVLLLTCHGSMATSEQRLIFENPPPNIRKIVLATNMAEASITINDIVFVVDCGKAKETSYDALNNTPCLLQSWISRASARQRRGRAGRVQPGECYHLYPTCVYNSFAEYQAPELLRTPLHSLCLQIKSLQLGSIGSFLSKALQAPEPLAVQNAIEFLKAIGALDDNENLTNLGNYLSALPVDPKLGKMLIYGAVFRCLDPILTVVSSLSVRDPFLLPHEKKDLAGAVKAKFAAKDYSDHMALVRAFEGWKSAEKVKSTYEYCWKNFLSAQTLQAVNSLRNQFSFLLKQAGLIDDDESVCNELSHNQSLVRAIICAGLFPGIVSVVHKEKSMALKTMDDGQVLLYANSVNSRETHVPYPWLVFNEKVKVNSVFIRDSTGITDSILLLFGGSLSRGDNNGQLKMLNGYLEFFMDNELADIYVKLKCELDKLLLEKLKNPTLDIRKEGHHLLLAVQELLLADKCDGKFVFGRAISKPKSEVIEPYTRDGYNPKTLLQTLLLRAGYGPPLYKTRHMKTNEFRSVVQFKGMQFVGKLCSKKQLAERDAAVEALNWLTGLAGFSEERGDAYEDIHLDFIIRKLPKRVREKSPRY